jgi:hypothetical protein
MFGADALRNHMVGIIGGLLSIMLECYYYSTTNATNVSEYCCCLLGHNRARRMSMEIAAEFKQIFGGRAPNGW